MKLPKRFVERFITGLIEENDLLRQRPTGSQLAMVTGKLAATEAEVDELNEQLSNTLDQLHELRAQKPAETQFRDGDVDWALWQIEHYGSPHVPIDMVRRWADGIRGNMKLLTSNFDRDALVAKQASAAAENAAQAIPTMCLNALRLLGRDWTYGGQKPGYDAYLFRAPRDGIYAIHDIYEISGQLLSEGGPLLIARINAIRESSEQ